MAGKTTDSPTLKSVELLRLFSKDGVAVRLAVFSGLICAEITLRAISLVPRIGVLLTILFAYLLQQL